MERQPIYSIYDAKSQLWSRPIFGHNTGSMVREFADIANDINHPIGKHPEDYCLFQIGEWDEKECVFVNSEKQTSLGKALDFVKQKNINPMQEALGNSSTQEVKK